MGGKRGKKAKSVGLLVCGSESKLAIGGGGSGEDSSIISAPSSCVSSSYIHTRVQQARVPAAPTFLVPALHDLWRGLIAE